MSEEGLETVNRQRAALAERVRLPWWYRVVFVVAVGAVLALPLASREFSPALANWVLLLPAVVVLLSLEGLLGWTSGARLSRRTMLAYPSSRPAGLTMVLVVVAAVFGENALVAAGLLAAAIGVLVVALAAELGCLIWQNAAIRDDIREGRTISG